MRKVWKAVGAAAFWLAVWHLTATAANRSLLLPLPTPVDTLRALAAFGRTAVFWRSVGLSALRIGGGFVLAWLTGALCAAGAHSWPVFRWLAEPLLRLIRAIPVAVFTIVVFLWVDRAYIPSVIVFLTVTPIVWSNVAAGLAAADGRLYEMAQVFGMKRWEILRHITLPQVRPYAAAAAGTGLGFAWKSGIAAEVICRTQGSLGDLLWSGKTSVSYDEVFALTVVIVACSALLQSGAARLTGKETERDPV